MSDHVELSLLLTIQLVRLFRVVLQLLIRRRPRKR